MTPQSAIPGALRAPQSAMARTRRFPPILDCRNVAELLSELFVDTLNNPQALDPRRLNAVTGLARTLLKAVGAPNGPLYHTNREEPGPRAPHLLRVYPAPADPPAPAPDPTPAPQPLASTPAASSAVELEPPTPAALADTHPLAAQQPANQPVQQVEEQVANRSSTGAPATEESPPPTSVQPVAPEPAPIPLPPTSTQVGANTPCRLYPGGIPACSPGIHFVCIPEGYPKVAQAFMPGNRVSATGSPVGTTETLRFHARTSDQPPGGRRACEEGSERVEIVRLRPEAERARRGRGAGTGTILSSIGPVPATKAASCAASRSPV